MEKEARIGYARAVELTLEQFEAVLVRKRVESIVELHDDRREALLDELRAGVDRRWQYKTEFYSEKKKVGCPHTRVSRMSASLRRWYARSRQTKRGRQQLRQLTVGVPAGRPAAGGPEPAPAEQADRRGRRAQGLDPTAVLRPGEKKTRDLP